jgi:putative transcriptional regulator
MSEPPVRNTVRVQRAIRDLTQADLARMAGMTRASVNAIEGGRMIPSILLALKLARALNVRVDNLFRLADETEFEHETPNAEILR